MEPRISIVTLGVDDLARAIAFYRHMGLKPDERFSDGVAFFQMAGVILALWPRSEIARDVGLPPGRTASSAGIVLAYNTRSEAEVAEVLAKAKDAGGRILKSAARAFWGGTQGYFEDPEGNVWEVAHNPDFPIDREGRIALPE